MSQHVFRNQLIKSLSYLHNTFCDPYLQQQVLMRSISRIFFQQQRFKTGTKDYFFFHTTTFNINNQTKRQKTTMLLLGDKDCRRALDPAVCLQVNKKALISLTEKTGVVPSRLGLPYPNNPNNNKTTSNDDQITNKEAQDWTLIKPAAYYNDHQNKNTSDDDDDVVMGLKVVSIRAENPSKRGLPLVPATILLLDAPSGIIEATLSGTYITAMRTSAGPALAVQTFQPNMQELVVFGAGAQAICHVQLIELAIQRTIPKITIINRTIERANELKAKIEKERNENTPNGQDDQMIVETIALNDIDAVASALATADVIAATTNATNPLWDGKLQLKKGCL